MHSHRAEFEDLYLQRNGNVKSALIWNEDTQDYAHPMIQACYEFYLEGKGGRNSPNQAMLVHRLKADCQIVCNALERSGRPSQKDMALLLRESMGRAIDILEGESSSEKDLSGFTEEEIASLTEAVEFINDLHAKAIPFKHAESILQKLKDLSS